MLKCRKNRAKLAAAAVLAACWTINPFTVSAESANSQPEIALPEVVVTATRTEQTVKDAPSTVQVITREEIEKRQSQTLGDVLKDAMGITIFSDFQGRSQVSIRGSESRHVLIMVDGRRIGGELSFNSVNAYDIDRIRMDNVERVEIIRGPAGALYGSDAMGGVINIITKKPERNEGRLQYEYSSWDGGINAGPDMQLYYQGVNDDGNFAWSVSAGQHRPHPFYDGTNTVNYYGKEQPIALSGDWTLDNGQHIKVDYSKLWEELDRNFLYQPAGMPIPIQRAVQNDNTRTDWSVEYSGKDEKQDWQVRAYRSKYAKDYSSFSTTKMGPTTTTSWTFDLFDRTLSVLEGHNSWKVKDNQLMTAGFEWRNDETEGTRIRKPGSTGKPVSYTSPYGTKTGIADEASIEYRAFYLQDEIAAGEKWLVIPSVRYDWSDKFSSEVTPRLGATYKAQDDVRIKAVIGQGYKTPSVNELYHRWEMVAPRYGMGGSVTTLGEFWIGNPNLKPEKSTDYELSIEKDWQATTARAGVFHSDIKDMIAGRWDGLLTTGNPDYVDYPNDKLRTYQNIAKATVQGFEGEVSHKLNDAVKLRLGYMYLDAENKVTNTRLEDRPRHQINFGITYQPHSAWKLNLDLVTAKDILEQDNTQPVSEGVVEDGAATYIKKSFTTVNFMAQNHFQKDTMMYFGVDNLSDHVDYDAGILGRTYRAGVQYKF